MAAEDWRWSDAEAERGRWPRVSQRSLVWISVATSLLAGPAAAAGFWAAGWPAWLGAPIGAAAAALAARPLLGRARRVEVMARAVEGFVNHHQLTTMGPDETERLAAGLRALAARLEATRVKADPARLEDPLTGLPNRLAAMRRARDEISRARRAARPLSVLLVDMVAPDVDEAARGRAFRVAAEAAVQTLRAYDHVGRWSDSAFVCVMPEAEIEHAVDAAKRMRDRLAADVEALGLRPSVAAGVAVLQPDDSTLADVVARAERALERARERGEGRVEAAPGPRSRPGRLQTV